MSATLIIVIVLLVIGEQSGDALERRQHEIVLGKLPIPEAHAHYERLRRRSRRIRILRAVTLASLLVMAYVYRHTANRRSAAPSPPWTTASSRTWRRGLRCDGPPPGARPSHDAIIHPHALAASGAKGPARPFMDARLG